MSDPFDLTPLDVDYENLVETYHRPIFKACCPYAIESEGNGRTFVTGASSNDEARVAFDWLLQRGHYRVTLFLRCRFGFEIVYAIDTRDTERSPGPWPSRQECEERVEWKVTEERLRARHDSATISEAVAKTNLMFDRLDGWKWE